MKRLLGSAALVLAVLVMVSGVAMAWDFSDHVKIAPNKKGDVLLFPVYVAINGGWETKFTVINTAPDRSVVAKVVFRSGIFSQELLDFLIYLTPTDVWTGVIRYNPTSNRVEVFSDDDSCFATAGVWASATMPFTAPLATLQCTADTNSIGYVEVFESAHTVAGAKYPPSQGGTAVPLNQPPASKAALALAYANWTSDAANVQGLVLVNDGINVLSGVEEFRNTGINQKASLSAVTFRDYGATRNPTNTTLLTVNRETLWGESYSYNGIGEVEAALAKNDLAMYYSNQNLTFHFFTFPTKYAIKATTNAPTCSTFGAFLGPYFTQRSTNGCIQYSAVNYDRSENSSVATTIVSPSTTASMCQEVQWIGNFAYAEGWARYTLAPGAGTTTFQVQTAAAPYLGGIEGDYTGAPVIGTVLNLNSTGDGYVMSSAAYSDGQVRDLISPAGTVYTFNSVNPTNYYYYQYQDERNMGTGYDINLPAAENQTRVHPITGGGGAVDAHHPINVVPSNP